MSLQVITDNFSRSRLEVIVPAEIRCQGQSDEYRVAYFDTGSQVTCIKKSVIDNYGWKTVPAGYDIDTVGGKVHAELIIGTISLGFGKVILENIPITVVETTTFDRDIIIGQDILMYGDFHTTYHADKDYVEMTFQIETDLIPKAQRD